MTTAYDDSAFRSQYEQLMVATQQQLHAPLKQPMLEQQPQQPVIPAHLAFTLSSPTSASFPSPLSSTHSLLSQSAPDVLPSLSCCSSSLLLPHLTSLASSFASHQQHVSATLLSLQAAVAEERREREAEAKRSKREEVSFRRRLQDRLDEVRDDCNDRLNQLSEQTAPNSHLPAAILHTPHATAQPMQQTASPAAYDSLSRELDSLRQQLQTLRTDLAALVAHSRQQPQPSAADVSLLLQRVEGLEGLTALHTATIQQQSDHYTAYRTQEVREKEDRRREADEGRRRDREERDERERVVRGAVEAELRRLTERMDKRDALDRSRDAEREKDRQRQEHGHHEQQAAAATAAEDKRVQQEKDETRAREAAERRHREEEQRIAAAEERERQKRLQAQAKAEAELEALRREQNEIDRARQEKLRQQEADRQRLEMERQKREQERKVEQERLQAEEQKRQREQDEAELQKQQHEQKLLQQRAIPEAHREQAEQHKAVVEAATASATVSAVAASVPYNLFLRLWNLPLSPSGNNNPIAALFLPSTTTTSPLSTAGPTPTSATSDGWQYCSQTEWMRDEQHPVFEQALLWDYDGTMEHVRISVYDVVDENVRDEDRLGSAIIPAHLLLAAATSTSAIVRPASSPVPPADAPVNGLTFRLVHEDAAKQDRLGDVILMVECEADQPATPQPPAPATAATMLLVRLTTIALPVRPNGALPSPIAAAFLESATGEMVYVDQTEWLKRTRAATFEQSMEVQVAHDEDERRVRLSVYDVDSEEVRDEDRVGYVELRVGELRGLGVGGVGREMELSHEEGGKERALKSSGSRVRVSVEVLAEEEMEFEVEERKAGRRAAPPVDAGEEEEEEEVDEEREAKEAENEESSQEEEDEEGNQAEREEVQDDDDDDDVELVLEASDDDDSKVTSSKDNTHHAIKELHSATVPSQVHQIVNSGTVIDGANGTPQSHEEEKQSNEGEEDKGKADDERKEEADEVYSDFGESSSEEEDEDEPQLQQHKQSHAHHSADNGHNVPLMPQLVSELDDEHSHHSPTNMQRPHSEQHTESEQQHDVASRDKAHESSSDNGSEIEEDIDVEFGVDDDSSHFDL